MTRQERGYRGLAAARQHLEAEGKNFHAEGGRRSWQLQNARAVLAGAFPNQSVEMWGFRYINGDLVHIASGKHYPGLIGGGISPVVMPVPSAAELAADYENITF